MKLFDATLTRLERSLDVRLQRHNVLAGNLANVDTPGYKAKDIDFQAALNEINAPEAGEGSLATTATGHMDASGRVVTAGKRNTEVPVVEASSARPGLDGNGVDMDRTMAALAENGMQYNAGARAVSKKLALLKYVANDGQG
jgi:flagellar basal-body rod protein FlgB